MKETKGKTITIVILIILLLGAISYICYDKFLTKDETNKVETKTDSINKEELIKQISFKLEDIESYLNQQWKEFIYVQFK